MNTGRRIEQLLSVIHSFYYNIKLFGWEGLRCPILIHYKTSVKGFRRGRIILNRKGFGIVTVGFKSHAAVHGRKSIIDLVNGTLLFEGSARFSEGVIIKNKGKLIFGDGFSSNKNCTFSCTRQISFGRDCLLGWNIHVRDSDGHTIFSNGKAKPSVTPVEIGNHVWIASESHILKGTAIPDDCVVGYGSLVNSRYDQPNTIIAGHPAKVVASHIQWEI